MTLVSLCIMEHHRTLTVLNHRDSGIRANFQRPDVIWEVHRRRWLGTSECNRIVDRVAEMDVL